jgi:DNA modification methylase
VYRRLRSDFPIFNEPLALLDRIISASSNPNNIVLDAFCGGGGGTALVAAQNLGRLWIGITVQEILDERYVQKM